MKNGSGCSDPTASRALNEILREEKLKKNLEKAMKENLKSKEKRDLARLVSEIVALKGYKIEPPLKLLDPKTGVVFECWK